MKKLLLSVLVLLFAASCGTSSSTRSSATKPKLVVGIIIDQFRYDYLEKFAALYVPAGTSGEQSAGKKSGGFNRLLQSGASMTNAHYNHSGTYTAPGHSTYFSGLSPSQTGIISNEWFDRRSNTEMYCVSDNSVRAVGTDTLSRAGKMSPKNFSGTSLGDLYRAVDAESKSIGVAIKDRGAILPAGVRSKGAFWFDTESGKWISSTYYFPDGKLPVWVEALNARQLPDSYIGKAWTKLLADENYKTPDDGAGEGNLIGEESPLFPHKLVDLKVSNNPRFKRNKVYDVIPATPYGNEMTIEIAKAALTGEQLGTRGHTDFLTVSFSSPDYCGHTFGPDSQEQQDILLRLDRQLESFFQFLDEQVGFENCLIVLSADHGVAPIPEQTKGGERLYNKNFMDSLRALVYPKYPNTILALSNDEIYLDTAVVKKAGYTQTEVEKLMGEAAKQLRGIAGYYTRTDLLTGRTDKTGEFIARSFQKERSGDVHLLVKPYAFFSYGQTGTTHGTPYDYDTHVPILLCGAGIKAGRYATESTVTDIVPTLCKLLGIGSPDRKGRILNEVMAK